MQNKIIRWLAKQPACLLILFVLLSQFALSYLFYILKCDLSDNTVVGDMSPVELWIYGSILAPLFETLLFQLLPIRIVLKINSNWQFLAIIISAALFSINHIFSITYTVYGLFVGIILATSYLVFMYKKNNVYAFFMVTLIHFIWNTFITIMHHVGTGN